MTRLSYELDQIVENQELQDEIAVLRATVKQLKEEVRVADACLDQVREWLDSHGINVDHMPPMFFPEACQAVLSRHVERECNLGERP